MKLYTEEQVEKLLKEQRKICEERADWLSYPDDKFFTAGKMLNADQPDISCKCFNPIPMETRLGGYACRVCEKPIE